MMLATNVVFCMIISGDERCISSVKKFLFPKKNLRVEFRQ